MISYNAAISACEKGGAWHLAHFLLREARHAQIEVNVISFNAALGATQKASLWQKSLALLDCFQLQSIEDGRLHAIRSAMMSIIYSDYNIFLYPYHIYLFIIYTCFLCEVCISQEDVISFSSGISACEQLGAFHLSFKARGSADCGTGRNAFGLRARRHKRLMRNR